MTKATMPEGAYLEGAAALLKLLADPTRLKILSALRSGELRVNELALAVGLSESAVSHQLRLLRTGRLVTYRKVGRTANYRLLDEHVTTLLETALAHAREL